MGREKAKVGERLPTPEPLPSNFFLTSVFITGHSFRSGMGREIVTISVPIGSQVWEQIQAWRQDEDANVSALVCAAIQQQSDGVNRLEALNRRHQWLGEQLRQLNPECGCRGIDYEMWMDIFGGFYDE